MDPIYVLAAKARDRIRFKSCRGAGTRIMRAEVALPRLEALAWLRNQTALPKIYWSDRKKACEVAACGAVDQLIGDDAVVLEPLFERMSERLRHAAPATRYYGGLRFARAETHAPVWREFGAARFVLPRFELRTTFSGSSLVCQWLDSADDTDALFDALAALRPAPRAVAPCAAVAIRRRDFPDLSCWRDEVDATLRRISRRAFEKLVLARQSVFDCGGDLDPLACLQALSARAERCYRFCFMPAADVAFLGLPPERLYRRAGGRILTEAVAGTRPRSSDGAQDMALARELGESEKESREHAYVVRGVSERIAPLCRSFRMSREVSVLKLRECQHLMSAFSGRLHDRTGDLDVLRALHPTPAVGGYPVAAALRELGGIETFDRGWYAGPVGWVGRAAAEFAVAIRSGLVKGSRLRVYAGAGIVEGSVAEDEWHELDNKIRHFTRILDPA